MLIAVDVGNSSLKVGVFDGETLVKASRLAAPVEGGSISEAMGIPEEDVRAVVVCSVSRPGLEAFLDGPGRGALVLGKDVPAFVPNLCRKPGEVGLDRLVNAAAGHDLTGGAAIVADLGSAVTVDLVSDEGAFLGGAIAPGLRALAEGLSSAAPALPPWDGESPTTDLPGSTKEAIRSGVVRGLAGIVERLTRELEMAGRVPPGELPALLTGGDAERLAPVLGPRYRHVPHLTLHGVRLLYDRLGRP